MKLGDEKYNRYLCIGSDKLNCNDFPEHIKNYIYDGIRNDERILIISDDISYEDLLSNFRIISDKITSSINTGKLRIKLFDPMKKENNRKEFLDTIEVITLFKNNIRILWDFKNLAQRDGMLEEIANIVDVFIEKLNTNNIKNLIYINNDVYDFNLLKKLCYKFKFVCVLNKEKNLKFSTKNEIYKCVWLLRDNAKLKFQNNNLVSFNDEFSSISRNSDEDDFKQTVMDRLIDLCDVDFCIIFCSLSAKENVLSLDSFYKINKKHMYSIVNDSKLIKWIKKSNESVIKNKCSELFLNMNNLEDASLKNTVKSIDVSSCVNIYVEHYQNVNGIICLGKYGGKYIVKENIQYMESICKAAFYLIQEQKNFINLQNKLIENEKLRAMGEMAAGISHDINNVLTPIIGSVQMLKEKVKDDNILRQLNIIETCASDGMNIASKVRKITRNYNDKQEWEVFDVDNIIQDCIDLTKDRWMMKSALKGIDIKMIPKLKSNVKIKGNITEIREVFINLIYNAVDAMPYGGNIEIITKSEEKKVLIEIRDNGLGMNKEIVKRVFEPFFTTKGEKGSGLGLSVSYKIIQSHFGSIEIESQENVGTSFQIWLPVCEDNDLPKIENVKEKKFDKAESIKFKGNILVVDDQERIRQVVSDMVKSISECKLKSCSGEKANIELQRRKYDIILCDFSMPKINGLQVAKMAKELDESSYFCLMTGWVGKIDKANVKNVDFVLNKPINKVKLKEMLYNYKKNKGEN
ncbi:ATP-binding protein [Haloimpatiens sp. FM7315]|uniref:hybrid sensor histidine kinase/response regulator n=1 Tax=Haloimpatiens sp. FM7315 TaxID=3298609 RepID=UPI00370B4DCE